MQSMTGYGYALSENNGERVEVEIRSINSRFFNFSTKLPVELMSFETDIKKLVHKKVKRGTISVQINYERNSLSTKDIINKQLLLQYYSELSEIAQNVNAPAPTLESLVSLPGVLSTVQGERVTEEQWGKISPTVQEALDKVVVMREEEGLEITNELKKYCAYITQEIEHLKIFAPLVVEKYQTRLLTRLEEAFANESSVTKEDVVREVAVFSERADVSEELMRLQSHIQQFTANLEKKSVIAKTLDFIAQEIIREANTIASKSNDADCSKHVVNVKSSVEKIREQLQNLE